MNRRDVNRESRITGLGDALRLAISDLGMGARLKEQRALMAWQSAAAGVVGDELASKTRASSIKNGDLTVAVEQDALRHRLLFERDRICGLINELVGRDVVRSIRFGR